MSSTSRAPSGASPAGTFCATAAEAARRRAAAIIKRRFIVPCLFRLQFNQINGRCPRAEQRPLHELPFNPVGLLDLWKVYEARVNPASALASTTRKRLCALRRHGYFELCYGLSDNLNV